jgi:membrane-associated protease RseP (regulator of RpoE activity)
LEQQNKIRVEVKYLFKFIPILILIHTPYGLKFFDWIAKTKAARIYARFNKYLMPPITALAIILIIGSLIVLVSNAPAREMNRDLGPRSILLLPGINPYLPWTYALISLIITIVIHEAGHGIVSRVHNVKIESTGIVLFFIIPVGAFVNIERNELEKTPLKHKSAIMTAGPLSNMILAGISLFGLYLVVSTLYPLPISEGQERGLQINGVNKDSLAEKIGLTEGSVIQTISGQNLKSVEDLRKVLQSNLGKTVELIWYDKGKHLERDYVALPGSVEANKGVLGVTLNPSPDRKLVLNTYKSQFSTNPLSLLLPPTIQPGAVPYSDLMADKYNSSIFGTSFPIVANMLFWLWFINFNVGIFNALPIGPLDGGQWYGSLIASRTKEKTGQTINNILNLAMVLIVIMVVFLPYIL